MTTGTQGIKGAAERSVVPWELWDEILTAIEAANAKLGDAPSIEAAYAMGAKGGPVVEAERLAFEAWMRGHCWSVSDTWDGSQYADRPSAKKCGSVDPLAMDTRRLWAVWRARAALTPNAKVNGGAAAER